MSLTEPITQAFREIFADPTERLEFAQSLVDQAKKGNATLAKEILLRMDGPARERAEDAPWTEEEVIDRIDQVMEMWAERREAAIAPPSPSVRNLFG